MSAHEPATLPDASAVVDTSTSPHARLRPVSVGAARIVDDFWSPRLQRNREETLPFAHERCQTTGALENFRRAAGLSDGDFNGRYYSDSDVYKWVESTSWALASGDDPELRARLDQVVALIAGAQDTDGYLNTFFSVDRVAERWSDIINKHEMYCLGHLVQAAVAHVRATGQKSLLEVATRAADLVARRYPPQQTFGACGHPDLEMALVELYRLTGEARWLQLAEWQLESRGQGVLDGSEYLLDHAPVREQHRVTGHAVRALYLYAAMADVVLETGDGQLAEVLDDLWRDLRQHKTSVTGGVGARWDGEAFGDQHELPDRAYNESCAAIASIYWAWRMLLRTGDGQYRDTIEWALYNAVLPGLSANGKDFFYQNPLADGGRHRRQPWFDCACCPPNITRLLASLPGYLCTTSADGLWVHLLIGLETQLTLVDGTQVALTTASTLPYQDQFEVTLGLPRPTTFTLRLPAPQWSPTLHVLVNGEPSQPQVETGYLVLQREWSDGDRVSITYDGQVNLIESHPYVGAATGRVAIARGPLVYCLEQVDHEADIRGIRLRGDEQWTSGDAPNLSGVEALHTTAVFQSPAGPDLYRRFNPTDAKQSSATEIVAVPYFAWANREPGRMTVLVPLTRQMIG